MASMNLLHKNCLHCGNQLKASKHVSAAERRKRNEAKKFCNGQCANQYRAEHAMSSGGVNLYDKFIYGASRLGV